MKYHYIYKTSCLIDGIYYIGRHSTKKLDDGYMGSGTILRKMFEIFGKENFKCEVLEFVDSYEKLVAREKELIDEALVNDLRCMNLALGGDGGWEMVNKNLTPEQRTKAGKAGGFTKLTPEQRTEFGKKGGTNARKAWNDKVKRGEIKHQTLGLVQTEDAKKRIGEAAKITQKGEKNSQHGTCIIHHGDEQKRIKKVELASYLESGWQPGMSESCKERIRKALEETRRKKLENKPKGS